MNSPKKFGDGDTSYKAAGGLEGITQLVDAFYEEMESLRSASQIRSMHPPDLTESRKKLAFFLCGWLGGPKLYSEHFGSIIIPSAHRHLNVGHSEVEAWLHCMTRALDRQDYRQEFKDYLLQQLKIPANRIRQACGN